jgi:hypothetical protein
MKQIFIVLFLWSGLFAESKEEVTINHQHFKIVKESYDIYDSKGEFVRFYKVNKAKHLSPVLRLTLKDATGGCSSRSLEDGAYEIKGNNIWLYRYFHRQGEAYLDPYGAQIVEYQVQKDGTLKKLQSKVYVELTQKGYDKESGMEYLFHVPKNGKERALLNKYVKQVEAKYEGEFLFGDEGKKLIKEVKKALKRKIKSEWKAKA